MSTRPTKQDPEPTDKVRNQLAGAYLTAVEAANWRPYSDMDDLARESLAFAKAWTASETTSSFDGHDVGKAEHQDRPAILFAIEACRAVRIGNRTAARDLLTLAGLSIADETGASKA